MIFWRITHMCGTSITQIEWMWQSKQLQVSRSELMWMMLLDYGSSDSSWRQFNPVSRYLHNNDFRMLFWFDYKLNDLSGELTQHIFSSVQHSRLCWNLFNYCRSTTSTVFLLRIYRLFKYLFKMDVQRVFFLIHRSYTVIVQIAQKQHCPDWLSD